MGVFRIIPAARWAVAAAFFLAGPLPALAACIFTLGAARTAGRMRPA